MENIHRPKKIEAEAGAIKSQFDEIPFCTVENVSIYALKESEVNRKTLAKGLEQQLNVEVEVEGDIMLNDGGVTARKIVELL